jgi:hypothetical protein
VHRLCDKPLAGLLQGKAGPAIGAPSVPNRPWRTNLPDGWGSEGLGVVTHYHGAIDQPAASGRRQAARPIATGAL